jgi:hypothetical protein
VNISVQHILGILEHKTNADKTAYDKVFDTLWEGDCDASDVRKLRDILDEDIVGQIRSLVNECRASDQHREALMQHIVDGNADGSFEDASGVPFSIPAVQLLRDVSTRWSSTYLMIERALDLYPVRLTGLNANCMLIAVLGY